MTANQPKHRPLHPINIEGLKVAATRAETKLSQVRGQMLAPERRKIPPVFSPSSIWDLCSLSKDQFNRRLGRDEYPKGSKDEDTSRRTFTLAEARQWVGLCHPEWARPQGARGTVIVVGQSKGGVGKTTSAVALAQGLSLRNLSVLVIDADPQGTASSLLHPKPRDIMEEDTLALVYSSEEPDVRYAIKPTYWAGIDLIAAMPALLNAEYSILAQLLNDRTFEFWDMLNKALEPVRDLYDVIVIDTAPSMSQSTLNCFFAADGMIVPTPTATLDYDASVHFWRLFADLAGNIRRLVKIDKEFQFIHVVPTKVESNSTTDVVRSWIYDSYPDFIVPTEIPKTAAVEGAAVEFNTIYDITKYHGSAKTYARAREAYDRLVAYTAESIMAVWAKQTGATATESSDPVAEPAPTTP